MTEQKKKLLKAKIAAALYHENGKVLTPEEIDKWTKFAQVLYTAVLGCILSGKCRRRTGSWQSSKRIPVYFFYSPFPYTKCMIYGYIRVSTDKQTTENQRFEILKFASEKKLSVGRWIEETISSRKKLSDRKLGALIERMHEDDILIVSELSRLAAPSLR